MNAIDRLLLLQRDNNAAGVRMIEARPRFLALKQRHELGTAPRAVAAFNLFQTPRIIAAKMAEIVRERLKLGARILEPSIGLGRLYEPFSDLDELRAHWVGIENARECVRAVEAAMKRVDVRERDFLETGAAELGGGFDAVIMNPPFKQGTDIKHIHHAFDMLNPGGRLVSLCYNGTRQNEKLRPLADRWEVLPEASFREEGTSASVALLVMDKA